MIIALKIRMAKNIGMTTTQRAESMNSFFDGFVNSNTSLSQFVYRYEEALDSRREAEEREDFKVLNSHNVLTSPNPPESHAGTIYTQKVFKIFQEEFKNMIAFWSETISEDDQKGIYSVFLAGNERNRRYIVEFNVDPSISLSCSCKKLDREGIFCTHVLLIMTHKRLMSLPEQYILHRWTINARYTKGRALGSSTFTSTDGHQLANPIQKWTLHTNFRRLSKLTLHSLENLEVGMSLINDAIQKLENMKIVDLNASQLEKNHDSETPSVNPQGYNFIIHDPSRVKSKGRPRKANRIKSSIEISMSQNEKKRACKNCGKKGHNKTTCPLSRMMNTMKNGYNDKEVRAHVIMNNQKDVVLEECT